MARRRAAALLAFSVMVADKKGTAGLGPVTVEARDADHAVDVFLAQEDATVHSLARSGLVQWGVVEVPAAEPAS